MALEFGLGNSLRQFSHGKEQSSSEAVAALRIRRGNSRIMRQIQVRRRRDAQSSNDFKGAHAGELLFFGKVEQRDAEDVVPRKESSRLAR